MVKILNIVVALSIVAVVLTSPITTGESTENSVSETIYSSSGIEHSLQFNVNGNSLLVKSINPLDWDDKIAGYRISVDNQQIYESNIRLNSGEQHTKEINITPGINVNQDNHTVTFSTYGNYTQFNFTREIDSSDPGAIPTPYISDVDVTDGTVKGESSVVANVTLVNPSEQLYSTKLMVHTVGTDGSLYPASVRPGDTRTISVELLDERGAEIAGEARLYTGNMTTDEGAIDQVEFAGAVESDTSVWNASYESVRPTWMSDNYEYENASYERSLGGKLSRGHEVAGVPVAYPVAALVVGALAVRKLR